MAHKQIILFGDLNCAHTSLDVARSQILGNPRDAFRYLHPYAANAYTFWANGANRRARNEVWRLDYFLLSNQLLPKLKCVSHHTKILG